MKRFTTNVKLYNILSVIFWLTIWQISSTVISEEILLVSPLSVINTLFSIAHTSDFWISIIFSFSKIILGFILAIFAGILMTGLSYKFELVKYILNPAIVTIKSVPVASFVILALVWIDSKNLSIFTSFLMAMPIVYTNVLEGLLSTDIKLLEMAYVFKLNLMKKIIYIYIPHITPFFISSCSLSIGLCWKSGIAAEVIGLPSNSIGEKLYNSKIFLNTDELFAWTFVIIIISIAFEKFMIYIIKRYGRKRG